MSRDGAGDGVVVVAQLSGSLSSPGDNDVPGGVYGLRDNADPSDGKLCV